MEVHMPATNPVTAFLTQCRDWWHSNDGLANIDARDLERIAGDLGMQVAELESLMARGPGATEFLYERMHALGISRADVERTAAGLMLDLEKSCASCPDKVACEKDLVIDPSGPQWKRYCPNAISLESIARLKGRFPA
jgi:hypothetical protein